jgi:hypothetical protein
MYMNFQKNDRLIVDGWKIPKFLVPLLACYFFSSVTSAVDFGVNIQSRTDPVISDIMKASNLKNARMNLFPSSNVTEVRAHVNRIKANGGKVEVTLQPGFYHDHSCNQDLVTLEQNAYKETSTVVNNYKDVIFDYELLNENTLRQETVAEVPFNSAKTDTTPYAGKPCYKSLTAALRGMSRAIRDVRASSGYPLRVMLGAVGRDFGFLTYMQQQGVVFDVVGYHIYPHHYHSSLLNDTWYGAGGLFTQLAAFKLPVHINEFDCGEIYVDTYDNQPNSTETYNCYQSYKKHIPVILSQKIANLESLLIYELLDEPHKSGAEARFGLMYDLSNPKNHLSILSAFAGGTLSTAEQKMITDLKILTDTEIATYKANNGNNIALSTLLAPGNLSVTP